MEDTVPKIADVLPAFIELGENTEGDQFRDATKMMPRLIAGGLAGLNSSLNGGDEILLPGIAQQIL